MKRNKRVVDSVGTLRTPGMILRIHTNYLVNLA